MPTEIEPFYYELGRRVQAARAKCGLSQAELGELLSPPLTRASIANIEGAKQRVLSHTLVELSVGLGVSVLELLPAKTPNAQSSEPLSIQTELERKLQLPDEQLRALSERLIGRSRRALP
jgi:transcriptional regulator with XRE-family HTH domain